MCSLLEWQFVVCENPDWATGDFTAITRTLDELSVVCHQDRVPDDIQSERDWRCFRVAGKLEFSLVGVIASLTTVLADAGISVFVISTFDTDFVLVKELEKAIAALEGAGHVVAEM